MRNFFIHKYANVRSHRVKRGITSYTTVNDQQIGDSNLVIGYEVAMFEPKANEVCTQTDTFSLEIVSFFVDSDSKMCQ